MPRAESLLARRAALVGCIGVASSLTPEFADRYQIVHGVLPPGVPARCPNRRARVRARADLALALARAPPAARVAARRRHRGRLGRRAYGEGTRLRGGDGRRCCCSPRSCATAAASTSPATRDAARPLLAIALAARSPRRAATLGIELRGGDFRTGSPTSSPRSASCSASRRSSSGCGRSRTRSRRPSASGASCASSSSVRLRQPVVLRAPARQELLLLADAARVPRVPRRRRRGA